MYYIPQNTTLTTDATQLQLLSKRNLLNDSGRRLHNPTLDFLLHPGCNHLQLVLANFVDGATAWPATGVEFNEELRDWGFDHLS